MNYRIVQTLAKWAGLYALMFLAWMLAERLLGLHTIRLPQQPVVGALILLPSLALYVLTLRDLNRNCYAGRMSWREGFVGGCLFTVLIVLLSPLNQWLTATVISPDYFANLTAFTVSRGIMTQEQAERQFNLSYYVTTSVVAGLITGALFSAIVAFFIRSRGVAA